MVAFLVLAIFSLRFITFGLKIVCYIYITIFLRKFYHRKGGFWSEGLGFDGWKNLFYTP